MSVSHAMRVSGRRAPHLLLKVPHGVVGLTPEGVRLVRAGTPEGVAERCRITVLPESSLPVGIVFEGQSIPIAERPDLHAQGWWYDAGEPVRSAGAVTELIASPRGALPAFASEGVPGRTGD